MSECDRALLYRARALMEDVYVHARELLAELPEGEVAVREVAEGVVRFLEDPRDVYLSYYPATPVHAVVTVAAQVVTYGPRELRVPRAPRVTFIVLYEVTRRLSDAELRYVLAHEAAHAASEGDEVSAELLASVLAARFPELFEMPLALGGAGLRAVDAVELERFSREHPREFMRRLLRCSLRLRPVRL